MKRFLRAVWKQVPLEFWLLIFAMVAGASFLLVGCASLDSFFGAHPAGTPPPVAPPVDQAKAFLGLGGPWGVAAAQVLTGLQLVWNSYRSLPSVTAKRHAKYSSVNLAKKAT